MKNQICEIKLSYQPIPKIYQSKKIESSVDCFEVIWPQFSADTVTFLEEFKVMYLNRANKVLGILDHTSGGISGTVADLRIILATALKAAASGIILAHNHPSGNLSPSNQDIELTKRFKRACELLDVTLIDHLIISPEGKYNSMLEMGYI